MILRHTVLLLLDPLRAVVMGDTVIIVIQENFDSIIDILNAYMSVSFTLFLSDSSFFFLNKPRLQSMNDNIFNILCYANIRDGAKPPLLETAFIQNL
jgi:hypothetical protein